MDILIISPRPEMWDGLKDAFGKHGGVLRFASSMDDALAALREKKAALALLDIFGGKPWAEANTQPMRDAVVSILMVDAMTNLASSCGMGHDVFHDAMEGLGRIDDLPASPSEADVDGLMKRLVSILG